MENKELNLQLSHYNSVLKNLAFKFTDDQEEICDLVQETFLRALKDINQFFHNPKIIPWLYVIMKNIYINHYRHRQQRFQYEHQQLRVLKDMGCQEPVTKSTVEGNLIMHDIENVLKQLPTEHKDLFMHHINGYKYRELSEIFNMPEGTIKSKIHLIRKTIKRKIQVYKPH